MTSTIRHSHNFMLYARGTRPQHSCQSIHSAEILQWHSSRHSLCCNHAVALIHHPGRCTHPSSCSQYLRVHRQGPMRPCVCALSCARSLSCTHGRAPVFLRFQRVHRRAALFDSARCPGRQVDQDAAWEAIARDGAAGHKGCTGCCGADQAAVAPVKTA